jgi:hypothetical protein
MHFPPLDEWDEAFLIEVAATDESLYLEKKASASLDQPKPDWDELAKQVCAIANASGGYLVYGIDKHGNFDAGVPKQRGTTDMADVVSHQVANLLQPHLQGYRPRPVTLSRHAPDRCILVVQIPLSEARPHWVKAPGEPCYIRVDRHSLPMPRQTFLDMKTRGIAGVAVIETLGSVGGPTVFDAGQSFFINPRVQLLNGPVCKDWCFEFSIPDGAGFMNAEAVKPANVDMLPGGRGFMVRHDRLPLFPRRSTVVSETGFRLALKVNELANKVATAILYAGAADPVTKTIPLDEFRRAPESW